jgi:uncharacterized protein (DUF885 family)
MTTHAHTTVIDLADRILSAVFDAEPIEGTLAGLREYDAKLGDISRPAQEALAARRDAIRQETLALDSKVLDQQDTITRSVILAVADWADDMDAAEAFDYTVAAFPVSPSSMLLAYVRMVVVTNAVEAVAYLERLRAIPRYLEQAEDRLRYGREHGILPVAHLVQMAIDQIDLFLASEPCPLAIEPPAGWDVAAAWVRERDDVIDAVVKTAFTRHRDILIADALPSGRSTDEVGLVYLPDGLERYRRLARAHTTTDRTPEDLHQTGLDLVAGIHEEFVALGLEIFGLGELPDIFARLNTDPSLRWTSSQEILDAAEAAVRRAEVASVDWFGRLPAAICELEAIPELEAAGAPAAYYMSPALDGSRPGTYYANVDRPQERTTFDLESVAYHEAVPGHHFQISLALELKDLPLLRQLPMFNAYAEGWGLYSERLADEMGLYSSPLQRMGMLSADAWRAARLVVDTGMHAFGWSRQSAVDYLMTNTPVAPIEVEAEIDRYIAMPGQALGYMAGRLEIESLRKKAELGLGEGFDIKAFHDTVLGFGGLPLAVLDDVVETWIATQV